MRRFFLLAAALAASVSASPLSAAAPPKVVFVRPDGNNACNGTSNAPFHPHLKCAKRTIQAGVNAVTTRGKVKVAEGTYVENVVVTKSVLIDGAGKGETIVLPAVSAPAPCDNSSLCGGQASNVFLVKASDVQIQGLTVDGANPALGGVMVEGMDIDARNGIIEDHLSGVYNHLTVRDVEVKNVYLRGLQAGSGGAGFLFTGNVVTNVRGGPASIAVFAFGASGTISANTVSLANDAISANQSRGVKITDNVVGQSGSGVHIDNNKPPAPGVLLDLIEGNTVLDCAPGGLGVWLLHPSGNAVINSNVVADCEVGLALLGGGASSQVLFSANTVTGIGAAGSTGILVTTDTFGFGHFDTEASFTANVVTGFETGALVDQGGGMETFVDFAWDRLDGTFAAIENLAAVDVHGACLTASGTGLFNHAGGSAVVHMSALAGNTSAGVENQSASTVNAASNWWGSSDGPAPSGSGDAVIGLVDASSFLSSSPVTCD